jgi:hypothetical protein
MTRDEVPAAVAGGDPQAPVTEHASRESLVTIPARSVRRATARRASKRRAVARDHQGDTEASIIAFIARHPESTAGDVAKGLNLDPADVAARLAQLAMSGEIQRTSHGYSPNETP